MKRILPIFIFLVLVISTPILAQNKPDNSKIDLMLIRGDYKKVVDTCSQILAVDTLNSEVYYKLGLAYPIKNSKDKYDSDYTESVKKRIESLKKLNVR
jgi:hypothetical protein